MAVQAAVIVCLVMPALTFRATSGLEQISYVSYIADHVKGAWEKELKDEEKAKNCIKCGKCEALCPQKLSIRDNLVQVQKDLDERIFA